MISSNVSGSAAYAAVQNNFASTLDGPSLDSTVTAIQPPSSSFTDMLSGAVHSLIETGHAADAQSTQALMGKGNLTDVVMAVSKAETALQTSVAVRDRVISAYQDIMRMSV